MPDTLPLAGAPPRADLPVDELAAAYDLGPLASVELLAGGKNQHHHLVTARGEFIVRRSYRSKTAAALQVEHALVHHLRSSGFPAPEVVITRAGRTWAKFVGRRGCSSIDRAGPNAPGGGSEEG